MSTGSSGSPKKLYVAGVSFNTTDDSLFSYPQNLGQFLALKSSVITLLDNAAVLDL